MAKYNLENYLEKDGLGFPLNFRRGNPNPLDNSSVWDSFEAAQNYAQTDPTAYVGQILSVVNYTAAEVGDDGAVTVPSQSTVEVYYIKNEAGTLEPVGTSPVGDEGTITVAEDGTVSLYGIAGLELTRTEEDGSTTNITYQPLYVNGKLTWVEPSATTVEGLAAEIEGLKTRISALETTIGNDEGGLVKDVADLVGRMSSVEADVEAVNTKIGKVADGKTVVQMIDDAQAAATYDDTQVKADIQANADAIAAIEKDYLKAVDKTELEGQIAAAEESAVDRILGYLAEEEVNTNFDTLKEVAAWIESDTTASAELVTRLSTIEADYLKGADKTALQGEIDALEAFVGSLPEGAASETVVSYIQEVIDSLNIGDYVKAAELAVLAESVTAAQGDIAEINTVLEGKVDAVDGQRLMTDAEGEKLAGIEAGAQVNKIEDVGEEFNLTDRHLTIAAIEQSKVRGLEDALAAKVDAVDGSRLMTDAEGTKLAGIDDGAEVNFIKSVDEAQFAVNAGNLTLLEIAMGKVTGLQDALDNKVNKVDGSRLISSDEAAKLEKLVLSEDGSVEISGEINASNVKELGSWITSNRDGILGLFDTTDDAKLDGIAAGAQVNVLEAVKVGGTLLDIVNKTVEIPVATAETLGVVKSSDSENHVMVAEDGTMSVNSLNVNKLVQDDGDIMILNGGAASV